MVPRSFLCHLQMQVICSGSGSIFARFLFINFPIRYLSRSDNGLQLVDGVSSDITALEELIHSENNYTSLNGISHTNCRYQYNEWQLANRKIPQLQLWISNLINDKPFCIGWTVITYSIMQYKPFGLEILFTANGWYISCRIYDSLVRVVNLKKLLLRR